MIRPIDVLRPLLALLFVAAPFHAAAQSCGDFLGGTVALSGDLHCTSGYTALGVGASGTTINLNGHTLSGSRALIGIDAVGYDNVTIRGPGRITGFWIGVRGGNTRALRVRNVRFENLASGISNNHGNDVVIADNEFINIDGVGVSLRTTPFNSRHGTNGVIVDNWFDGGMTAIQLCGMNTYGHTVRYNRITNQSWVAIELSDETSRNTLFGNDVDNSYAGLALFNARENTIRSERYTHSTLGIWMVSQPPGACVNSGSMDVVNNRMEGMSLFNLDVAAMLGGAGAGGLILKNRLNRSKIYDNDYGLVLESDSYGNVAVQNAMFGTTTPIQDTGTANTTTPNWCDPPGC